MPTIDIIEPILLTAGGGTKNLPTNVTIDTYVIEGTATLTSNWTIQPTGTEFPGMKYKFKYKAGITPNSNTITIFGKPLPETLYNKSHKIESIFNGTIWETDFYPDVSEDGSLPAQMISNYSAEDKSIYIPVPISFESGELGYQRFFLPFYDGFKLHAVWASITKNIEPTDGGSVKFFKTNNLIDAYTHDAEFEIVFVGNTLQQLGVQHFNNINHPIEFTGAHEILIQTSKTTPGGKGMLYFEIIKN